MIENWSVFPQLRLKAEPCLCKREQNWNFGIDISLVQLRPYPMLRGVWLILTWCLFMCTTTSVHGTLTVFPRQIITPSVRVNPMNLGSVGCFARFFVLSFLSSLITLYKEKSCLVEWCLMIGSFLLFSYLFLDCVAVVISFLSLMLLSGLLFVPLS